jgi:hypothetical protein
MPGASEASSTTAPAPSPKSTQVPRSFQSRMRENTSAPTTSARLWLPELDELLGGGQRIGETRAYRLQIKGCPPVADAQLGLQQGRRTREDVVRR